MMLVELPALNEDPFDPAILGDVYPFQKRLLAMPPVFWVEKYGTYGTARYETVKHVLNNWEHFSTARGVGLADLSAPGAWREPGPLIESDPPRHSQLRTGMTRVLSPKVIRSWRGYLEETAANLLDEVFQKKEIDAVSDLTESFIMAALPSILGVDADRENLIVIGNHNFNTIGPANEIFRETKAKLDAISSWYDGAAKADAMKPGGLGELVFKAEQEGQFEPGLAYALVRSLLRGGFDTTIAGLGSTLLYLAKNPDQYELLKENPKLVGAAFEEALRLEPPSQGFYRTTTKNVELAGVPLKDGTKIQVWLSAANRDPARWEEPDRFNIQRDTMGVLTFGDGVHRCLGQMIARLEADCFLTALVNRVDKLELAGEPSFRLSNTLRTLDTLPLKVTLK